MLQNFGSFGKSGYVSQDPIDKGRQTSMVCQGDSKHIGPVVFVRSRNVNLSSVCIFAGILVLQFLLHM